MRQLFEAIRFAGCTALAVLHQRASGTEITDMVRGRRKPSAFGTHQIATIRAVRREIEGRHEPLTLTKRIFPALSPFKYFCWQTARATAYPFDGLA